MYNYQILQILFLLIENDGLTRIRTLYLRSSGDGNTEEFFPDRGSVINRSLQKLEIEMMI